jgi:O-antigen/teichoic acid export membrane protein
MQVLRTLTGGAVAQNSIATLIVRGSVVAVRVVVLYFVARRSEVEVFGYIGIALSLAEIGKVVADFGLDTLSVREYALAGPSVRRSELIRLVAANKVVLGILIALMLAALLLIQVPGNLFATTLVVLAVGFGAQWSSWSISFFQADMRMAKLVPKAVFTSVTISALLTVVLLLEAPLIYLVALIPLHEAVNAWLFSRGMLMENRHHGVHISLSIGKSIALLKRGAPIAAASILAIMYGRFDVLGLSMLSNQEQVGLYNIAARVTEPVIFVASAVTMSTYGLLAKRLNGNAGDTRKLITLMLLGMVIIGLLFGILAAGVGSWAFGGPLSEYSNAQYALWALAASLAFRTVSMALSTIAYAQGRSTIITRVALANFVVILVLSLSLARPLGATGAALAVLVGEAFNAVLQLVMVKPFSADATRLVMSVVEAKDPR